MSVIHDIFWTNHNTMGCDYYLTTDLAFYDAVGKNIGYINYERRNGYLTSPLNSDDEDEVNEPYEKEIKRKIAEFKLSNQELTLYENGKWISAFFETKYKMYLAEFVETFNSGQCSKIVKEYGGYERG